MSRNGYTLTIKNLDKWQDWLKGVQGKDLDQSKSRVLRTTGLRLLEYTQDLTPRRSSRLAQSMTYGDKDNYFELRVGKTSYVVVGSCVKYAEYIENGYTQRAGRFVPGYWKGDVFNYDPEADGGMVLTGAVIEGAHMFKRALDNLENSGDLDKITEFEMRRLFAKLAR